MKKAISTLLEFSVPLILGVVLAMVAANVDAEGYHRVLHTPLHQLIAGKAHSAGTHAEAGWAHVFTLHFLVNDLFMVLFFGVAAKEITEACLPDGALNPVSKALNPLLATAGGVIGPICVFLLLNNTLGEAGWNRGWGIPTATDIALAWLVARLIFGRGHPAVSFLLLLAVADDAIGLGIIAIGYPDPNHPTEWTRLAWLIPGMVSVWTFRRVGVRSWIPYVAVGGACCWWGLYSAHLHPALALVFVIPFLPGPERDLGLYIDPESADVGRFSTLERFEHDLKWMVDLGLFFFAFANAGVPFGEVNGLTWIVLASLILGKMIGITGFSWIASRLGLPLPDGMSLRHLVVTSLVAGLGLTVALFVCGQAFVDPARQGAAKMGAVLSVFASVAAWTAHRMLVPAAASDDAWDELSVVTDIAPSTPDGE